MENNKIRKVLFVCLGNICRSPAGEGVFKSLVEKEYLGNNIFVDSAGLINYHSGEKADSRMIKAALLREITLDSIARKVNSANDFKDFDYIIGMDKKIVAELKRLSEPEFVNKIYLMTDFCTTIKADEVPDPYYGGPEDFNHVLDILEDACYNLLEKIKNEIT